MAECDQGYHCRICGDYVESIVDSEIYLRYVFRDLLFEDLSSVHEAHIWCNGNLAQYITDPRFDKPIHVDPEHDKAGKDPQECRFIERLITRAWQRLQTLPESGLDVTQYPLEDVVSPEELGERSPDSESIPGRRGENHFQ